MTASPSAPPTRRGIRRPPRPPAPHGGRRPPRPPKRPPLPPPPPLTGGQVLARGLALMVSTTLGAFVLYLVLLSGVQHLAVQQQREDTLRAQLAEGTLPVSEGDVEDRLLVDGQPLAIIDAPSVGLYEVIAEGTSSAVLAGGPGHRRDTVLPGQAGVSVVMGRAAAYGGPFGSILRFAPGDTFTVRTGQGLQEFEVMGLRYAGDPTPPAPVRGESRLILMTARGAPFVPTGVAYVDARATTEAQPAGTRQTTGTTLPARDQPLATDTTTVWALVFALQFLVVAEVAAVWAYRRFGAQRTWIVFAPVIALGAFFVADQVVRLLPNLL